MSLYLPFLTEQRSEPDMGQGDVLTESGLLIVRQQTIMGVIDGEVDAETLLDLLESQGIDPVKYVEAVEQNTQAVINGSHQLKF